MQQAAIPHTATLTPELANEKLGLEQQRCMVQGLQRSLAARQGSAVTLIETHISFVLVACKHAYKIKKALRTPFLDQSTLALRQLSCQEELRLNRRLAPDLYLAVVPITGTAGMPEMVGTGATIEVAVKMQAFAQEGLWDGLAARGQLGALHVDELVHMLSQFHAVAAVADPGASAGLPPGASGLGARQGARITRSPVRRGRRWCYLELAVDFTRR